MYDKMINSYETQCPLDYFIKFTNIVYQKRKILSRHQFYDHFHNCLIQLTTSSKQIVNSCKTDRQLIIISLTNNNLSLRILNDYFISIIFYEMWKIKIGDQVSKNKTYTRIRLE